MSTFSLDILLKRAGGIRAAHPSAVVTTTDLPFTQPKVPASLGMLPMQGETGYTALGCGKPFKPGRRGHK